MKNSINDENMNKLFEAILKLENIDECRDFFTDLCTVAELRAMSQRFEVALMLRDKCQYSDIIERTGASTVTISRIKKSLNYGKDGYNLVIDRLADRDKTE